MVPDAVLFSFLELLARNLPALILLFVCTVITWVQWNRHPSSARWALFACLWFVLTDILAIIWYSVGFFVLQGNPNARDEEFFCGLALSCMEGLGYAFFLLAVNAARTPYRPRIYFHDFPEDDLPSPKPVGKDE